MEHRCSKRKKDISCRENLLLMIRIVKNTVRLQFYLTFKQKANKIMFYKFLTVSRFVTNS